jgi:hypothetical protein
MIKRQLRHLKQVKLLEIPKIDNLKVDPNCIKGLKLLREYDKVSDEFGFNPKEDKQKLIRRMTLLQ